MARLPEGGSILGRELAELKSIPGNYLSKILLALRNAGLVEATRGHHGGYRLAKPPTEIYLIDVVRHFEGISYEPGCLLGEDHDCSDELACGAHTRWKHVVAAYMNFIETTTIADLGEEHESKGA